MVGVEIGNYVDYQLSSGKQLSDGGKSSGFALGKPRLEDVAPGLTTWDGAFQNIYEEGPVLLAGWLEYLYILIFDPSQTDAFVKYNEKYIKRETLLYYPI